MIFVVVWLLFSGLIAVAAMARGRTGIGWFLIPLIISPLFALILVLALPSVTLRGRMRVDIYDGKTRVYRRVRLDETVPPEDVDWVEQEILLDGICKYRGRTICETGYVPRIA
jgi:hypothetical protein